MSTYFNGCHGDLNETFMVGNVDAAGRNLVKTAYMALSNALDMVRVNCERRTHGSHTVLCQGSSSDGRARASHARGEGIDALILKRFFFFSKKKKRSRQHTSPG